MDPRDGTNLALTASVGQSAREQAYRPHLTWWQRKVLSWVFRDPTLIGLLTARFEARALRRWAWLWERYIEQVEAQEAREATRQLLEEDPRTERSVVHFLPAELEKEKP